MPTRDDDLDETLEETFPASDAPANTVEVGVQPIGNPESAQRPVVRDNPAESRFEATLDGHTAVLVYQRGPGYIDFVHTEVPPGLRGRGIANHLAEAGLAAAHAQNLRVIAHCPFVRSYLERHHQGS